MTGEVSEVRDGFSFTRFLVKSDERTAASRKIVIEIKHRENEAFTFGEIPDSAELVIDMPALRVVRARKLGWRGDGTPMDWETRLAPDVVVFQWKYWSHEVPTTLPVLVPAFALAAPQGRSGSRRPRTRA